MTNLAVFNFKSNEVRFVDGKPVANDIASVLGYADPAKTVSTKVFKQNKGVAKIKTPGGIQSVMVLEESGVLQLVSNSKLPNAIDIAKRMGMTAFHSLLEQDCVRILESAFSDLNPVRQFAVHGYRIDLYLAEANIAIECDEYGHSAYDPNKEKEREGIIKRVLGCSFIRFNPNDLDFNIGSVILNIRGLI